MLKVWAGDVAGTRESARALLAGERTPGNIASQHLNKRGQDLFDLYKAVGHGMSLKEYKISSFHIDGEKSPLTYTIRDAAGKKGAQGCGREEVLDAFKDAYIDLTARHK